MASYPERWAACPYDEKILPFYEGQFESVYVLLHPFFKPHHPEIYQSQSAQLTKQEHLDCGIPVRWSKVLELTGLKNLAEIDVGLRTGINGIKSEFANNQANHRINIIRQEQQIFRPDEGYLSPLLENDLLAAIKNLGYELIEIGDEITEDHQLHYIDDVINSDIVPCHGCIFTQDHKLLLTTHWDSHCSFLCSSKEVIERILSENSFEGFFCTLDTEVYWGIYDL